MHIFGFDISRTSRRSTSTPIEKEYYPAASSTWGWLGHLIMEPFAGAWQKNIVAERKELLLAFSAVYSCIDLIAADISKLELCLQVFDQQNNYWKEAPSQSPFWKPIYKPNAYQTRIQFIYYWIVMKLMYGNVYVFLEREPVRRMVVNMYVLDSRRVTALVADDGSVWYRINQDRLSGIPDEVTLPASEVVHDRCMPMFHPLVGVSPIFACGASATQGIRIQNNSAQFFSNMSRPSGQLYSTQTIKKETAERLKTEFEQNFSAGNLGRFFVGGDGLKFEAITIPAADAQLIEQLKWTVEDVARCFHVPLYKIASGENPKFSNFGAMNLDYYAQALQIHIEAIEALLVSALAMPEDKVRVKFDVERGLLRMDPTSRADINQKKIAAGYFAPNEARADENLPATQGGDSPMMQQQYYSLAVLAQRDQNEPFAKPLPAAPALPAPADGGALSDMPSSTPSSEAPMMSDASKLIALVTRKFAHAALTETIE